MELKLIDKLAPSVHQMFGITEKRSNEISQKLDKIVKIAVDNEEVSYGVILTRIAEVCDTPEELVYAVLNNHNYMVKKGYLKQ